LFKSNSSGNKRTRKYKLFYYLPEILAICYLAAYGIAEYNYYSNPTLSELAKQGLTTKGSWIDPRLKGIAVNAENSMEAFKPWKLPEGFPPENSFDSFPGLFSYSGVGVRPLTFIETDIGGALLGLIPVGLKYSVVALSRFRKTRTH
jgi:hypothetical protein